MEQRSTHPAGGTTTLRRALVAVAAACLALAVCASAETLNGDDRLQFADGLYAREMHELALKEYEAFLRDFTNSPKADVAHFRMGECQRRLGDAVAADKEFKLVFDTFPGSEWRLKAGLKRADLAVEKDQYATAVELLDVVLKENPPADLAASALYTQGAAYHRLGNTNETVKAFEKVRAAHAGTPYAAYAALSLGRIYADQGLASGTGELLNKAGQCYRQAADKPATDRVGAEALFQLADLCFRRGMFDPSADAYRQLFARYPGDVRISEARLPAGWAAHNAGLYADALATAQEYLKGSTGGTAQAEWLYLQANCQRQLLKHEDAVGTYEQLLARFPASPFAPSARYEKALSLYKLNRYRDVIAELSQGETPEKLRKDSHWLRAESYAALKDGDNAIQYYRLIVRDYPDSDVACDATYRLAHQLQVRGAYAEAAQSYSLVASRFPTSSLAAPALFASAACFARDGKHADAVRDWTSVVQKYPGSPLVEESLYQKGVSEVRLRRDADALATLQQLLQRSPKSRFAADAWYWIGMLQRAGGKDADAEQSFRKALVAGPREDLVAETQFQLARTLQNTGKADEAADLLGKLLASPVKSKFSPALLEWLSGFSLARKDYPGCIRSAQLLVDTNSPAAAQQAGWSMLGQAQLALGEKAAAASAFRRCLTFKDSKRAGAEAALALGNLAWEEEGNTNAVGYYTQAAALAADESLLEVRARAYAGLGRAAKAGGDSEGAGRYFMSVAILFDDPVLVPECLFEAAESFKKLGRAPEAEKTLKELRDRYPQSDWAKRATGTP